MKTFAATATLIGTIIGAGFLAIPYVVSKSGFFIGVIHLLIIGVVITFMMLYLGEIALRTKKPHQLSGYAERYLGKKGKLLMFLAVAFGVYAAILAYLVAEGESLSMLLFNTTSYAFTSALMFWLLMSLLTMSGMQALKKGESYGVTLIALAIIVITLSLISTININNLTTIHLQHLFTPFGVILFAYLGFTAITEVRLLLTKKETSMKSSLMKAHLFAFVVYALFTFIVLGSQGSATPEIATLALGRPFIVLGILTMFTSYLALSFALIDTYRFDFHTTKRTSWLLTFAVPLALYLFITFFKQATFTMILGLGGVISGGLTAILILLMVEKAKQLGDRKPEYSIPYSRIIGFLLVLFFIAGMIVEIAALF